MKVEDIASPLDRFVHAHYGASAAVDGLAVMEAGHAGLTFGFGVLRGEDASVLARLVVTSLPNSSGSE